MKTTVISFISILIILSNLYSQGIPYGQEFQVNTYSQDWQSGARISVFSDNRFIVVWASSSYSGSTFSIFTQQFNSACEKSEQEFQIDIVSYPFIASSPVVALLSDSCFVVCWQRWEHGFESRDNVGQIFKIPYTKIGSQFLIGTGQQRSPSIAASKNSTFLVCWCNFTVQDKSDIFGQLYNSSGEAIGNKMKINTKSQGLPSDPSVTALTNGNYMVCWQRSDGPNYGIFGQLIDLSGAKIGDEFQISDNSQDAAIAPSVSTLSNGGFAVCWHTSNRSIKGQLFDELANKKGDELSVYTNTNDYPNYPDVAELSNGDFVISWGIWTSESSRKGIFGQLFDKFGAKKYSQFKINTHSMGSEMGPSVGILSGLGFVICWQSENIGERDADIFGKCFPDEPRRLPLHEFSLLDPLNDATKDITGSFFRWHQPGNIIECYPWEITFDLYIDNEANFPNPKIINNIQDTTYTIDSLAAGKTYFWKVLAINLAGDSLWSTQQDWGFFIKREATLVADADNEMPQNFELFQNFPNPFNSNTEIKYSLSNAKASYKVQLKIYDVLGRLVKMLVNQEQSAGSYAISWDGTELSGNRVASGVYFYSLEAGEIKSIRKMLVLQ